MQIYKFFLNAYSIKSGLVVLINYIFLTSYFRIIKSFLKSTDLSFAVNRVCYLRKDAFNVFYVCIGSAQIKKGFVGFKCLPMEIENKSFVLLGLSFVLLGVVGIYKIGKNITFLPKLYFSF